MFIFDVNPKALYAACGLPAEVCAHSFRGTGITEYLRLKLSTRCGQRPKAPRMRQVVVCGSPASVTTAGSRNPASRDPQLGGQAALPVSE